MERGYYRFYDTEGKERNVMNARFENTGKKFEDGKVIWRKLKKDGTPTNKFAEQFRPDAQWLPKGKWFMEVNGGVVLENYPELLVETEKYKELGWAEYIEYLYRSYNERYE